MKSSIAHTIDGEYIREWLVLGPFFPDDLDTDFLADSGGEANIQPREGDTVTTADGRTLTWKLYKSPKAVIDLLEAVGKHEYATAYSFCILQSEATGGAEISLGSDDGVAVWINGEQVHQFPSNRAVSLDQDVFWVNLKAGANRCLIKVFQIDQDWGFAARAKMLSDDHAMISGVVMDEMDKAVPNLYVYLKQDEKQIEQTLTDRQGRYHIRVHPVHGKYDLYANTFMIQNTPVGALTEAGEVGAQQLDIHLDAGEHRAIDLKLRKAISIEGYLLMLDNTTSHVAVPVQAISDGKVFSTVLSDGRGRYRFINLRPGRYQVRCQIPGRPIYYVKGGKPTVNESSATFIYIGNGKTLDGIGFRFAPFKKGVWRHYGPFDGLAYDIVLKIYMDSDGMMWLATPGGVSRYDGKEFVSLTPKDGLVTAHIRTIHQSPDGMMWFGGWFGGVSRYGGREFKNFTDENGLPDAMVISSYCDPEGIMWFGQWGGGVSRYDGVEFINFTREEAEGAPSDTRRIYGYPDGTTWFTQWESGISRYNGKQFTFFTTPEELREASENEHELDAPASDSLIWGRFERNVCLYDGRDFVNIPLGDSIQSDFRLICTQRGSDGSVWFALWAPSGVGISCYDSKCIMNFTTADGLLCPPASDVYIDEDGVVWIASGSSVDISERGGLSRYDSKGFVNFTTKDGLPYNAIKTIEADINGVMWIGTGNGLSRYDGNEFVTFNTGSEKGLASDQFDIAHRDPYGIMWFGTSDRWILGNARGISRYDGEKFEIINQIFTEEDGLVRNRTKSIHSTRDGVVWFATQDSGVYQYDGKEFQRFDEDNELKEVSVQTLYCASDGMIWFGTERNGIYRYDEKSGKFHNFTKEKDGLADNNISSICSDSHGGIWFATAWIGVSYYNGGEFVNFTTDVGLASDIIKTIYCGSDGTIWVGTEHMGVSGYNGSAWTTLDTRDGLAGNQVTSIYQDAEGYMWFGTKGGLTRYRRGTSKPLVRLISVTTDQTYTDFGNVPAFHPDTRVTIEYSSIDFKTIPEKRQYRCRIRETDSDWRMPTKAESFDCVFDKPGVYTFQVQAIDRDLNYSEPVSIQLEVIADPRNHRIIQLEEHIRQQELTEMERMQQELEDARQIQQSLLPDSPPEIEGFQIAGVSKPAKEVSGDFYTYLTLGKNTGIVLADVTGKSVKAAMVAAMTNGMLNEAINAQRELWNSPSMILSRLNTGLQPHLIRGMYAAMSLAILQSEEKNLIISNSGMPYPIIKRGDKIWEPEVSGLPLGLTDSAEYDEQSIGLQTGDLIVFYSDGVTEAENEAGEIYQTERLLEVIQQTDTGISAQEMVDLIVRNVTEFVSDVEPSDDITIVVIRCDEVEKL